MKLVDSLYSAGQFKTKLKWKKSKKKEERRDEGEKSRE